MMHVIMVEFSHSALKSLLTCRIDYGAVVKCNKCRIFKRRNDQYYLPAIDMFAAEMNMWVLPKWFAAEMNMWVLPKCLVS